MSAALAVICVNMEPRAPITVGALGWPEAGDTCFESSNSGWLAFGWPNLVGLVEAAARGGCARRQIKPSWPLAHLAGPGAIREPITCRVGRVIFAFKFGRPTLAHRRQCDSRGPVKGEPAGQRPQLDPKSMLEASALPATNLSFGKLAAPFSHWLRPKICLSRASRQLGQQSLVGRAENLGQTNSAARLPPPKMLSELLGARRQAAAGSIYKWMKL